MLRVGLLAMLKDYIFVRSSLTLAELIVLPQESDEDFGWDPPTVPITGTAASAR